MFKRGMLRPTWTSQSPYRAPVLMTWPQDDIVWPKGTGESTATKPGQSRMVSKEMFEKRPGGRSVLGRGTACAKALGQVGAWCGWSRVSE